MTQYPSEGREPRDVAVGMTKQEKIREMVRNYLVGCIHGATASYEDLSGYDKSTVDFQTDELLEEQSKLGAVLKVERELPSPPEEPIIKIGDSLGWGRYRKALEAVLDVATEPLVAKDKDV